MRGQICLFALLFLLFECSTAYGQTTKKTERSAEWEYKQLISIKSEYYRAPQYDRELVLGTFVKQFGFPDYKTWPGYNAYWPNPSLSCDGFAFRLHGNGVYLSINLSDSTAEKIIEDRKHADLVKKWESFKP